MTAIYAFASKRYKLGVMVSDDLIPNLNKKADKIELLYNRFAIGICGLDMVERTIGIIDYMSKFTSYSQHQTVELLIDEIFLLTKFFAEKTQHGFEEQYKGKTDSYGYKIVVNQPTELILIDRNNYSIHIANLGFLRNPTKMFKKPEINKLQNDKLHLFALASVANSNRKELFIKNMDTFIINPVDFCEKQLNIDKKKLNASNIKGNLGEVGATIFFKQKKMTYTSCFSSAFEFLDNSLGSN